MAGSAVKKAMVSPSLLANVLLVSMTMPTCAANSLLSRTCEKPWGTPWVCARRPILQQKVDILRGGGGKSDEEKEDGAEEVEAEDEEVDDYDAEIENSVDGIADDTESESRVDVEEGKDDEATIEVQPFMEEQEESSFATANLVDDPSIDDDSSAFVDRMELADAYDEGETTPGSFEEEIESRTNVEATADNEEPALADASEAESLEATDDSVASNGKPAISVAMAKILREELKYSGKEVSAMKSEIATMVVEKRLHRPTEGMPPNWYRDGKPPAPLDVKRVLTRVVIPVAAGALAVRAATASGGFDFDVSEFFEKIPFRKNEPAPVEIPVAEPVKETIPSELETFPVDLEMEEADEDIKPVNEHTGALGDAHPHSVKPGQVPQDELDVTWLDKAITAVERRIKAFFRMEL